MAIYVNNSNKVTDIFINVNGEKRKVKSVWVNKDNVATKVFGKFNIEDSYEIAPTIAYSNWNYTLDEENNIITLNYYKGSETDVIVYANYVIGEKTYQTKIASNADNAHYQTTKYMFNGYSFSSNQNIRSIKFSESIDTSNVTNMYSMFCYCKSLNSLDISCFNTSNVTNMSQMFAQCRSLDSLDLSNFDTSNVTNMYSMFNYVKCRIIDLSNFNTSNVTNMGGMFYWCPYLEQLNLSSFDTRNVTDMTYMFANCPLLNIVYVTEGKWLTSQAKRTLMFSGCGVSSVTYV